MALLSARTAVRALMRLSGLVLLATCAATMLYFLRDFAGGTDVTAFGAFERVRRPFAKCLAVDAVRSFVIDEHLLAAMVSGSGPPPTAADTAGTRPSWAFEMGVFEGDLGDSPLHRFVALASRCAASVDSRAHVDGALALGGEHARYLYPTARAHSRGDAGQEAASRPLALRIVVPPADSLSGRFPEVQLTVRVVHVRRNFAWFSSRHVESGAHPSAPISGADLRRVAVRPFLLVRYSPVIDGSQPSADGEWQVPDDPAVFNAARTQGVLTECDFEQAMAHRRQYGKAEDDKARMQAAVFRSVAIDLLATAAEALEAANATFWINSGTLLGWRRECGVIPHTRDVDVGIYITDYSPRLVTELTLRGFEMKHALGLPSWGYELSLGYRGIKLDIFFFYVEADHAWNGGTQVKSGRRFKYTFPLFTLCRAELATVLVRVPCNATAHVVANYGLDWRTPVKSWDWKSSPNNVREDGVWPENIRAQAIRIYKK